MTDAARMCDLAIDGMSCVACVSRVERALASVPGVRSASVNLATERAHVLSDPAVTAERLLEAVARTGYTGRLIGDADSAHPDSARPGHDREAPAIVAGALLSAPLLLAMLLPMEARAVWLPGWLQLLLGTVVQFWLGARFYRGAFGALRAGGANMDLLIALGTSAAYGLSAVMLVTAAPGDMPHLYFESAAVVITLVRFGKWLELKVRRHAAAELGALGSLRPETARRLDADGVERDVGLGAVAVGDRLVLRAGERVPVDGVVLEGRAAFDEAFVTGEALPVERGPGAAVAAGSLDTDGRVIIEARAIGAETRLARIVRLIESAQAEKPPIQRLVDRISAWFVPIIVAIAASTLFGWLAAGAPVETAVVNAVAVLVIACPCALGLATPMAILAGTGAAARAGILLADPRVLETAPRIRLVVFDKSGTLTEGKPVLVETIAAAEIDKQRALAIARALQSGNDHPYARAIRAAANAAGMPALAAEAQRVVAGRGVFGHVAGTAFALGSRQLVPPGLVSDGDAWTREADAAEARGQGTAWLLRAAAAERPGAVLGLFVFADRPRPEAAEAVARLKRSGLRTAMLTGDRAPAARALGASLGIEELIADASPDDKVNQLVAWRAQAGPTAMVGDGINDAPALAKADLGIAMAGGTDVAMGAAAITLLRADLTLVPAALDIARRTRTTIHAGLFWAFVFNLVGVPLAAAGRLDPVFAGAAMAASSLCVVLNATALRLWRARGSRDYSTAIASRSLGAPLRSDR